MSSTFQAPEGSEERASVRQFLCSCLSLSRRLWAVSTSPSFSKLWRGSVEILLAYACLNQFRRSRSSERLLSIFLNMVWPWELLSEAPPAPPLNRQTSPCAPALPPNSTNRFNQIRIHISNTDSHTLSLQRTYTHPAAFSLNCFLA